MALMFEDSSQLLDLARSAEELGFTGIALADHIAVPVGFRSVHPSGENPFDPLSDFIDPLTTFAAMASITTTLRFLTYVYILPMREPFSVAKQGGSLGVLSDDRFAMGVGAGWLTEEIQLLGHDPARRGRRFDEMIDVIQGFWRNGTFEYHGEFYDFGPTGVYPVPNTPPPIWVGGKSPAALRRAARCDGWLGMNYGLDEIWDLLDQLAEARRQHDDEHGAPTETPQTLVIPMAMPSRDLYTQLEERGVTATISMPWYPGDPTFAKLPDKIGAMETFAGNFLS